MKILKRTVGLLLCAALLVSVLCPQLLAGAFDNSARIAVGSDLHYQLQKDTLPVHFPDDELYSHAEGSGILYNEVEAIINEFLNGCAENEVDCVIIPGDLTRHGSAEQHKAVAKILGDFEDEKNIPVYVTTGNHDLYGINSDEFRQIYYRFGFDEAVAQDDITASYAVDIKNGYRLIAIDSCTTEHNGDAIDERLYTWIEQQAADAKADNRNPIATLHHPIMKHLPLHTLIMGDFVLSDWEAACKRFADCGIKYFFTGHEHGNDIAMYTSPKGNEVYDVLTCALTASPLSYRIVDFTDENVSFNMKYIDSIDMSTLTDGYNDAQKALMISDYPGYAFGFFVRSLAYNISNTIRPEKIKKMLKAEEGTLADTIDLLIPRVEEALSMPLYRSHGGLNSIEELANKNGASLPPSNYKSLYDLVGSIVAYHYAGDENHPLYEFPEGDLFVKGLNTGLIYILQNFGNDAVTQLFSAAADALGLDYAGRVQLEKWCVSLVNGGNDSYELADAFLSPLLMGFLVDYSEPSDIALTLPACAAQGEKPDYIAQAVSLIKAVFEYLLALVKGWIKVIF